MVGAVGQDLGHMVGLEAQYLESVVQPKSTGPMCQMVVSKGREPRYIFPISLRALSYLGALSTISFLCSGSAGAGKRSMWRDISTWSNIRADGFQRGIRYDSVVYGGHGSL